MDAIPTLSDIARLSGFSKSTVSLALNHHPRIPEATTRGIRAIADRIGYHPDPALARIAANRWRRQATHSTIAFLTTDHPDGGLLDGISISGARSRAEMFGYRLEHFQFEQYNNAKRLGEVIFNRGIRGVIVGKLTRPELVAEFPWAHFAAVACDTGFVRPPVQLVMPDHAHAVHRAWQEAANRGYRRIGLVLFDEYSAIDYFDKMSAYLFNQRLLPAEERLEVGHINPHNTGALRAWIEEQRPDVILGFNPLVYYWLQQLGCRVPEKLGFISLLCGKSPEQNLAMLREDMGLLGQVALEQLDLLLRTNQFGLPKIVTTQLIESTWIPGASLRDLKLARKPRPRAPGKRRVTVPVGA
jgi:LacI family transcriptional regulator